MVQSFADELYVKMEEYEDTNFQGFEDNDIHPLNGTTPQNHLIVSVQNAGNAPLHNGAGRGKHLTIPAWMKEH